MVYNKRTHIEQEEKLKERGVRKTLWEIRIFGGSLVKVS